MITRLTIALVLFCSSLFASAQGEQTKNYPIVIKFTSIGTGVPDKKPVTDFIRAFQKKNKIKNIKADTLLFVVMMGKKRCSLKKPENFVIVQGFQR